MCQSAPSSEQITGSTQQFDRIVRFVIISLRLERQIGTTFAVDLTGGRPDQLQRWPNFCFNRCVLIRQLKGYSKATQRSMASRSGRSSTDRRSRRSCARLVECDHNLRSLSREPRRHRSGDRSHSETLILSPSFTKECPSLCTQTGHLPSPDILSAAFRSVLLATSGIG